MIFSKNQLFSDDQAITGTAVSTNVIDLGAPGTVRNAPNPLVRDIGAGTPVPIVIQVTEDFTLLTSLAVAIQVSDAEGFGTSTTVLTMSKTLAELKAGVKFPVVHVPLDVDKRYVRLNYTVTGTNPDGGKITAGIVMGVQTNETVAGAELDLT